MTDIVPGLTTGTERVSDRGLVERLIDAFHRADETTIYSEDSQWSVFRRLQEPVVEAIRARDVEAVSRNLRLPHEGYLLYGFEDLGAWNDTYKNPGEMARYAAHCYELVQRLARALGVLAVPNPEALDRAVAIPALPVLLDRIEAALAISIDPPEPYPFYRGLRTDRGVLGGRVLNALYCAWRIKQLTAGRAAPRILEIGAGIGRLADYCHRMGFTDYWIVDLPITSLAQGYFLARALGDERVVLDGEPGAYARPDAVKIMNPVRFFADERLHFDIVVNCDSLTEVGKETAMRYFRRTAERSPILFSVNHEVNPFRMVELNEELGLFDTVDRRPYWIRNGYVEEIFTRPRRVGGGSRGVW